ncbi:hypothetical protein QBC46DRAFT_364833 [Diplogelasinospora grovesii]|uniref:Uncharacterized protein n=1 Tax=Diplogelasinospora grovesii TaxID=303347 RepID=A0AAN6S383_9PEZI|nr:hypothetical protein QBC46DRAFT_364833 [Diplogelasinospora grovesii]
MTTLQGDMFDRTLFESVSKRRFFFTEAFEVYRLSANFKGDNSGLSDYGPPVLALQTNIVDTWRMSRKHFALEENMLELGCTVIRKLSVKTSGHFADWMCKDSVKAVLDSRLARGMDSYGGGELGNLIKRLDIRDPDSDDMVLPPIPST